MTGRVILLLLAFIFSLLPVQVLGFVVMGTADFAPGAALPFLALGVSLLAAGLQFFCSGFLFTLLSGLPWRRAGVWTWAGIAFFNMLTVGPGAMSHAYFAAAFTTILGVAHVLVAGGAAFYGCWFLEQREDRPWVEQARGQLMGLIGQ